MTNQPAKRDCTPQWQQKDLTVGSGRLPDEAGGKLESQKKKIVGPSTRAGLHHSGSNLTSPRMTFQAEPNFNLDVSKQLPKMAEAKDAASLPHSLATTTTAAMVKDTSEGQHSASTTASGLFHVTSDGFHQARSHDGESSAATTVSGLMSVSFARGPMQGTEGSQAAEQESGNTPRLPRLPERPGSLALDAKELLSPPQRPGTSPALPKLKEAELYPQRPATTSRWTARLASCSPWWGELDRTGTPGSRGTPRGNARGKRSPRHSPRFEATLGCQMPLDSSSE